MDGGVSGFMAIMSFVILGCGLYMLKAWYEMTKTGEINGPLFLGKTLSADACKDKEAFVKKTRPMVLGLGILTTAYGIIDLLYLYVFYGDNLLRIINTVMMVATVVSLILFTIFSKKLKRKYFL